MQHRYRSFAVLVLALLAGGCAGMMGPELRDGRTMEKGKAEGSVRLAIFSSPAALLADSVFNGGPESVAPAVGVGGYYGLADRLELYGAAWSSAPFNAPATFFRTADIGLRGGVRLMVTPRAWRNNIAFGIGGWWHGGMNGIVRFEDDLRYYGTAFGVDPSLVWSYRLADREEKPGFHSIYLGGRMTFARADFTYGYSGGDSGAATTVREYHGGFRAVAPFVGVGTFGGGYFEAGAVVMRHPESDRVGWIPMVGFGWKPQN